MDYCLMPYLLKASGRTDPGLVRKKNEDAWKHLIGNDFFVIADGMGGHKAGEVAAQEAVTHTCALYNRVLDCSEDESYNNSELEDTLAVVIEEVNRLVREKASEKESYKGMGTTLCCLHFHEEYAIYGHVGDSRIYRLRDGRLECLTQDHSLLMDLTGMGHLSKEELDKFLYKNILTMAVGTNETVTPSVQSELIEQGDLYLMCTDGLTDMLSEQELIGILMKNQKDPKQDISHLTLDLILAAKQKGGKDNITVVCVKVEEKV